MPNYSRTPVELTPAQALADFQLFEEFFQKQPPALRFLSTGIPRFDDALGGNGIPSNVVTSWHAPRLFAADFLLLEVCRAACARGERVALVDAFDRLVPERLQIAGLADFARQGLFERVVLDTIPSLAVRVDTWRTDENEDAPDLLVVDSFVATVESKICGNSAARSAKTERQGRMFYRLLIKMKTLASRQGTAIIVAETAIQGKSSAFPRGGQSLGRPNHSLGRAAFNMLRHHAKTQISIQPDQKERGIVSVRVEANHFAPAGNRVLIDIRH